MSDSPADFGVSLGFTPAWYALGIVNPSFLARARTRWEEGEDPHTEHYRYWAFGEFLTDHGPLSPELAESLYELGSIDADQGMGTAMIIDILSRPECPRKILEAAVASGHRPLVRAAESRLATRRHDSIDT